MESIVFLFVRNSTYFSEDVFHTFRGRPALSPWFWPKTSWLLHLFTDVTALLGHGGYPPLHLSGPTRVLISEQSCLKIRMENSCIFGPKSKDVLLFFFAAFSLCSCFQEQVQQHIQEKPFCFSLCVGWGHSRFRWIPRYPLWFLWHFRNAVQGSNNRQWPR